MTNRFIVYCPYCGAINREDDDLLKLQGEVYSLLCNKCEKSSVLAIYEILSSEQTITPETARGSSRAEVEGKRCNSADLPLQRESNCLRKTVSDKEKLGPMPYKDEFGLWRCPRCRNIMTISPSSYLS